MEMDALMTSGHKRKRGHCASKRSHAQAQPASITKRLFISGIAPTLSPATLEARLSTYGEVVAPLQLGGQNPAQDAAFGHCTLRFALPAGTKPTGTTVPEGFQRLRKLSGTVLKGAKLRIEEAKPDWQTRLQQHLAKADPAVPRRRARLPKPLTPAAKRDTVLLGTVSRRAREGKVVQDSELKKGRKRGWIKGKYGRALCVLKQDVPPGKRGQASGKPAVLKPTDPEALQKLWGVLNRKSDQLTGYYDSDDETWHDRRGRIIHEQEIRAKRPRVADQGNNSGGRVEIWDDEEGADAGNGASAGSMGLVSSDAYTTAGSARPDYTPADAAAEEVVLDEATIATQLQAEKSMAQSLLADMFGSEEPAEAPVKVAKENKEDPELKQFDVDVSGRDLKSLFKPAGAAETFTLFDAGDESEEEPMPDVIQAQGAETTTEYGNSYASANKTQLGKDRGFNNLQAAHAGKAASVFPSKSTVWPLLFSGGTASDVGSSALLSGLPCFFPTTLPEPAKLTADWEASRQEATRDWKRKRREGAKRQRKSAANASSAHRGIQAGA